MTRALKFLVLFSASVAAAQDAREPGFDYSVAQAHEIAPLHHMISVKKVEGDFSLLDESLDLTLLVAPNGDVLKAEAKGGKNGMKYWPEVQPEVLAWKFQPFEQNGKPVTAKVEEHVTLVPPEQLPRTHIKPPEVRLNSDVAITLTRSACMGSCPAYSVTITPSRIAFEGKFHVVAQGKHTAKTDPDAVRDLARRFVDADVYSMASEYRASITDCPTFTLSISIDGHSKSIVDYMGRDMGMPAVISELEESVDSFARTDRWIKGSDGLIEALKEEKFNFHSYDAQVMLKAAAASGAASSVQGLLDAGVPLQPYPAPPPAKGTYAAPPIGWLQSASFSKNPETLKALIDAGASEKDQRDKNLALLNAARNGSLPSVQMLIDNGANPNADFSDTSITHDYGYMTSTAMGGENVLLAAASSANPDVIREILRYQPDLQIRNLEGNTPLLVLVNSIHSGAPVAESIRLLVQAGADINATDRDGNTALHEATDTDVEQELLKLGANVNARNKDGETPIFTTFDNSAVALYIEHGADLSIRNHAGKTVMEAAEQKGPLRVKALREAIAAHPQN